MTLKNAFVVMAVLGCQVACAGSNVAPDTSSVARAGASDPQASRPAGAPAICDVAIVGDGTATPVVAGDSTRFGDVAIGPRAPDPSPVPREMWIPTIGAAWQVQRIGSINTSIEADVFDVDLFDAPMETITQLQAQGRRVVCSFSAGSLEDWRDDASGFPGDAVGAPLGKPRGERWLDIRASGVRDVMRARLDLALSKGCDAVEIGDVDGYTSETGFAFTADDQLEYNAFLASEARSRTLAVGLRNDSNQIDALVTYFDFAVAEECIAQDWCLREESFVFSRKPVVAIEFGGPDALPGVCSKAVELGLDAMVKNRELDDTRYLCR